MFTINEKGKQRQIFSQSPTTYLRESVISLHHSQEIAARQWARRMVTQLRTLDARQLATDELWLKGQARIYGVSVDHQNLFVGIVQATINADRIPVYKEGKGETVKMDKPVKQWKPLAIKDAALRA